MKVSSMQVRQVGARLAAVPAEVRHGRLVFTASTARGVLHYEIVADK